MIHIRERKCSTDQFEQAGGQCEMSSPGRPRVEIDRLIIVVLVEFLDQDSI